MDNCLEFSLAHLVKSDDNLEEISRMLAGGADPNYRMKGNFTPFHEAARSKEDNVEVIKELIRYGANVNLRDDWGYTALHYAATQDKFFVVEALLESGALVNAKTSDGVTPLHIAIKAFTNMPEAHEPDTSVIEELVDHEDIDFNAKDFDGNTPLMVAVKEDQPEAVELLLHKKLNPNIPDNLFNTPLHVAFAEELENIAFELLRIGADIYALNLEGKTPLDIFFEKMTIDDPYSTAPTFLKFIAFRYHVTAVIKQKLQRYPELLQLMEKLCEEVIRMKLDILIYDTTFHDFILNCYEDQDTPRYPDYLISEMHKRIIRRFMMGLYPEYFMEIFVCVPASVLREELQATVDWRKNSQWCNDPKLFSNADITHFLSLYLPRLDMFCLILSLSNARIPEWMRNIREQKYS